MTGRKASASPKPAPPVEVTVQWGDGMHTCPMSLRTWNGIKNGRKVVRVEPYWYEGKRYTGNWTFNHNGFGTLLVTYGDGGVGFDGLLGGAIINVEGKTVAWESVAGEK
jgi:hypothetical protein